MQTNKDIKFVQLNKENYLSIANALNQDPEVNQYVSFYNLKLTVAIMLNNQIIGLFSLINFIENNLAIHLALLKEYRNKGLGEVIWNKIVQEYGILNTEVEFFIANTDYKNKRALKSLDKAGWNRTDKYDEMMDQEGGSFYIIYEKENPYYCNSKTRK